MKVIMFQLKGAPQNSLGLNTNGKSQAYVVAPLDHPGRTKIAGLGGSLRSACKVSIGGKDVTGLAVEGAEVDGQWLVVQRNGEHFRIASSEVVFIREIPEAPRK